MLVHEVTGSPEAPTVVMVGSLGTTRAMWAPQVATLSEALRVVTVDHRGHGGSPAPPGPYRIEELGQDLLEVLDKLGVERVHYAGLSLGGMVGMWLAALHPARVDRLALLCTAAYLPPAASWLDRAAQVRANGTASITQTVLGRWVTPGFTHRHPGRTASLLADLAATPAEGYAGCCEAIAAMDLRPMLTRISAPTLVIAGAQDPATPPSDGAAIAAAIPGARLEILDQAAHLANVEQPDAVTHHLLKHFQGEP